MMYNKKDKIVIETKIIALNKLKERIFRFPKGANAVIHMAVLFLSLGLIFGAGWALADTVSDTYSVDVTAIVTGEPPSLFASSGSSMGTQVVFSGMSFPSAKLTVLKDGVKYTTLVADETGYFRVVVNGLANGNYQFAIYAQDQKGIESSPYVANVLLEESQPETYQDILIPPTILVSNNSVLMGQMIMAFGYAPANSTVIIEIPGTSELARGIAGSDGLYQIPLSTNMNAGMVQIRAKAELNGMQSAYSKPVEFRVYEQGSEEEVAPPPTQLGSCVDYSSDNRINLVDFSILLYWFGNESPPQNVDCNGDQEIDIKDFSILMYFWTG